MSFDKKKKTTYKSPKKYNEYDENELAKPRFIPKDKPFSKNSGDKKWGKEDKYSDKKSFFKKPYKSKEDSGFGSKFKDKKSFDKGGDDKRYSRKRDFEGEEKRYSDKRNFDKKEGDKRYSKKREFEGGEKRYSDKRNFDKKEGDKRYSKKPEFEEREKRYSDKHNFDKKEGDKRYSKKPEFEGREKRYSDKREFDKKDGDRKYPRKREFEGGDKKYSNRRNDDNGFEEKKYKPKYDAQVKTKNPRRSVTPEIKDKKEEMRLNKYVANSGICSRREADDFIAAGKVTVNGEVVKEMGFKVKQEDVVKFDGRTILPEPYVYILMNKPKDFITTTDDEKGRKTVLDLVSGKVDERVYPVGRLDRNTTGVLLLTNDGEVAQKLTHPSFEIKKVYHVVLDKKVAKTDLDKLVTGIDLEDGTVFADAAAYVETEDKTNVGIEIHSGKNRVVRRMFEHLGYEVEKLDRVSMGIFTKKDLPRGKWRFLSNSEIGFLLKLRNKK